MPYPVISAVVLAIVILFVAFAVSGFLAIAVDLTLGHDGQKVTNYFTERSFENVTVASKSVYPFPTDKYDNIFTFVQISDLHISKFRNPEMKEELKDFCRHTLPQISPSLVLVTGDIVDAKDISMQASQQYSEEWQSYEDVVKHCHQYWKTDWIEIRGNHDGFAVPDHKDQENMFRQFSHSRSKYGNSGSYQHVLHFSFGSYAFNGLDLVPNPGPKRPYNFFGIVEEEDIHFLHTTSERSKFYNATIWFGHYPLSTITTTSLVRNIVSRDLVYLCGHLHTLHNLVPTMHLVLPNGHMELENGDWYKSKRYRILAVDHDLLSFVDATYPYLPVILVTNPLPSQYSDKRRQPFQRMLKSTHIRFFVFTRKTLKNVRVVINDIVLCKNAVHVKQNLYVCPWKPSDYANGRHKLEVKVLDSDEKQSQQSIIFSLEGLRERPLTIGAILLFLDFCLIARTLFLCIFIVVVILPYIIRQKLYSADKETALKITRYMPRQATDFIKSDFLFYPWLLYNIYLIVGPMFIGELIPGSIGLCFIHGLLINGHWLPGSLTYVAGGVQVLFYSLPLALYLGELTSQRKSLPRPSKILLKFSMAKVKALLFHSLFAIVLCYQVKSSLSLRKSYGTLAFLLSPVQTWSIFFAIWLVHRTIKMS